MTDTEQIQQPVKKNNSVMIGLLAIALVAAVSFVALAPKKDTETGSVMTGATASPQPEQAQTAESTDTEPAGDYTDGTYEAVGEYTVPGAKEQVGVSVTIENGVITGAEVEQLAKLPISKQKQADFAANYKEQVVGRNIDEVELVKVSGSSLTPKGFNDALEKIKSQAKS